MLSHVHMFVRAESNGRRSEESGKREHQDSVSCTGLCPTSSTYEALHILTPPACPVLFLAPDPPSALCIRFCALSRCLVDFLHLPTFAELQPSLPQEGCPDPPHLLYGHTICSFSHSRNTHCGQVTKPWARDWGFDSELSTFCFQGTYLLSSGELGKLSVNYTSP